MRALAFALALFACASPVAAGPFDSVPWSGSLVFGIWRSGDRIGSHSYAFRQAGDDLIVEQQINVVVRFGFITVYRQTGKRLEVWRDGNLIQYDSETDEDGTPHRVRARLVEGGLVVEGDFGVHRLPAEAVPLAFWNRAAFRGVPVFNDESGRPMKLTATLTEDDFLSRYHVTGDVNFVISYVNSILRGVRIAARDGSTVEYVPEQH